MAKYWRGKILAHDSQFAKILLNQKLPLKCLEYRAKVVHQLITVKSLVSIIYFQQNFTPPIFRYVW